MAYASTSDLTTYGIPAAALGTLTNGQQVAQLDAASQKIDSFLRARYALPLLAWGSDITEACCIIAGWNLICIRGFNPANPGDQAIRTRYEGVDGQGGIMGWLKAVERQAAHPNVTPSPSAYAGKDAPLVLSSAPQGWIPSDGSSGI